MAALSDTEKDVEQIQIGLFRAASTPAKVSLMRSLTRTAIELSRRAIRQSAVNLPEALRFVGFTYGFELSDAIQSQTRKSEETWMKSPPDLLIALTPVVEILERLHVPYFIGGSIASSAHGVPQATADIDLVAALRDEHISVMVDQLQDDYYVDETSIRRAISNHRSFNLIHLGTMIKVDIFIPASDPYYLEAAARVTEQPLEEGPVHRQFFLASAEDVIIAKLDWDRRGGEVSEKQWNDILGVLKVRQGNLDFDYLKRWVDLKNLDDLFDRALKQAEIQS